MLWNWYFFMFVSVALFQFVSWWAGLLSSAVLLGKILLDIGIFKGVEVKNGKIEKGEFKLVSFKKKIDETKGIVNELIDKLNWEKLEDSRICLVHYKDTELRVKIGIFYKEGAKQSDKIEARLAEEGEVKKYSCTELPALQGEFAFPYAIKDVCINVGTSKFYSAFSKILTDKNSKTLFEDGFKQEMVIETFKASKVEFFVPKFNLNLFD